MSEEGLFRRGLLEGIVMGVVGTLGDILTICEGYFFSSGAVGPEQLHIKII